VEQPSVPRRHIAIVTCMDSRIDPLAGFGLEHGDAHILRNGGAAVTDDVLRSLVLSQRVLGTVTVWVMAHTDCGLRKVRDDELARELEAETGEAPPFAFETFFDEEAHVRAQVEKVRECRWLPHRDDVRGFVYDVADGSVRQVV
jgi:carbonic anhydrase